MSVSSLRSKSGRSTLRCTAANGLFDLSPADPGRPGIWPVAANIVQISLARIANAFCTPTEREWSRHLQGYAPNIRLRMIRSQSYQAVILTAKDEIRTLAPLSLFNHLYLVMVAAGPSNESTIRLYV